MWRLSRHVIRSASGGAFSRARAITDRLENRLQCGLTYTNLSHVFQNDQRFRFKLYVIPVS